MKLLKIALSLIAFLLILLITAVIVLPQLVDPNDYRDDITQAVNTRTGLTLSIEGDLSLSVFPWLGIKTGKVTLSQPQSVSADGQFLAVNAANIHVKLAPLLSKRIEVDTILLERPDIHIIVNKAGLSSIEGINQQLQSSSGNTEAESTPQETASTATQTSESTPNAEGNEESHAENNIVALSIAGIRITEGNVVYDDQQNNTRYQLKQLNINSGDLLSESSVPVSISGVIEGNQIETVTFSLDTQAQLEKEAVKVNLSNIESVVTQGTSTLNTSIASLGYQHQSTDNQANKIAISGKANDIAFAATIDTLLFDAQKTIIDIPELIIDSLGAKITANIHAKPLDESMIVSGNIASNTINLQTLLEQFAIDYTPSKSSALTRVSVQSGFNATANGASLQNAIINIDDSEIKGSAALLNFSQPAYRFDLSLNQIVIDDYLPVSEGASESTGNSEPVTPTQALLAPIAALNELNANGVFHAGPITASNITLDKSVITVKSSAKKASVNSDIALYKGTLTGSVELNKGASKTLLIKKQLRNVELEPLLTDAEITDQFSGIGNIDADITVVDNNNQASTKGTVKVIAKDGAIKGVDIKKVLDEAQDTIDKIRGKGVSTATRSSSEETRFAEMTATLLINNDIITNNDLSIKAPIFRISGEGSVDTRQQIVDYLTSIVVVNTNSGQGGEELASLKGFTIPVRFKGPLNQPDYSIDTQALIKANTQQAVEKEKQKLKEKALEKLGLESNGSGKTTTEQVKEQAKEKIEEKIKDKLKGFFN